MDDNDKAILKWWCAMNFCERAINQKYGLSNETCPLYICCQGKGVDESNENYESGLKKIKKIIAITKFLHRFNYFMKYFVIGEDKFNSRMASLFDNGFIERYPGDCHCWFYWIDDID